MCWLTRLLCQSSYNCGMVRGGGGAVFLVHLFKRLFHGQLTLLYRLDGYFARGSPKTFPPEILEDPGARDVPLL